MSMLKQEFKTIYSLRIRNLLSILGFEYIKEVDNPAKPGFKCWLYEATPELLKAFDNIVKGGN